MRRVNDQLRPVSNIGVTLSIGVAVTHKCKRNVAQLVAIADAAMYDAKEGGKDQVVAVNADPLVSTTLWGADPRPQLWSNRGRSPRIAAAPSSIARSASTSHGTLVCRRSAAATLHVPGINTPRTAMGRISPPGLKARAQFK